MAIVLPTIEIYDSDGADFPHREIYEACYRDPVLFCFTFLKDWFPVEDILDIEWFQRGLLAILCRKANFLLDYPDQEKIATNFMYADGNGKEQPIFTFHKDHVDMVLAPFTSLIIPRGFTKTTCINASIVYEIEYSLRRFIGYISHAALHAELQLSAIKNQVGTNERLVEVFGPQLPGRDHPFPNRIDDVKFLGGHYGAPVRLIARGAGAQIRGLNDDGQRPDRLVIDDGEDRESVATDTQREKRVAWLFSDVRYALPRGDPNATLTVSGTLLHKESMLMVTQQSPLFQAIKFGALDRQGEPLWSRIYTHESLDTERQAMALVGQLKNFHLEIMSTVRDDATAKFREESIIIEPPPPLNEFVGFGLAIDPAIAETTTADFFAAAVCGMTGKGLIWVLDFFAQQGVHPAQQIDIIFAMYNSWPPHMRVGIEAISYQRALVHLTREEMFRRRTYFEINEIKHGKVGKHERVEGILVPRYASHYMRHARNFPILTSQLLDWPAGKKDGPDAVAMAVSLLDPFAAAAATGQDLGKNSYKKLRARSRAP